MATFHRLPYQGTDRLVGLVKGGPDVVLARRTRAPTADGSTVDLAEARSHIDEANARLGSAGLRVLALAVRTLPPTKPSRPSWPTP